VARVKITESTVQIAALIVAMCAASTFEEDQIEQLCLHLDVDPFQLRELLVRALDPAADIPVENEAMPPAWYDNNVQLSRLLLEMNEVLIFGRAEREALQADLDLPEDGLPGLFAAAQQQLTDAMVKYRI